MKLTLRDLFWLALLVAALTTWRIEHRERASAIGRLRWEARQIRADRYTTPSREDLNRQAALAKLSQLNDDDLDEHFASLLPRDGWQRHGEYEPCLVEMARRGLCTQLQRHYDALMAG